MKRWMFFAAPVTVALILGVVVYALPASGSSTSLISRVAKLEAQTKALKTQNTKLTKQVANLNGFINGCLIKGGIAPISLDGNPSAGEGYLYTQDNKVSTVLNTGLNLTPTGQTPAAFAALIDGSCVQSSSAKVVASLHRAFRVLPMGRAQH